MIALCTDQGIPFFLAIGTILQGWALAEQGQGEEGIAQMHQGMARFRATGSRGHHAVLSGFTGRGIRERRDRPKRAGSASRGAVMLGQNWGALLRGGAVSAERGVNAATGRSKVSRIQPSEGREKKPKRVFSKPSTLPASASEVTRTAGDNEPRPALAAARQATEAHQCYPRSTTGSPKGLTPRICKRPKHCWKS